MADLFQPSPELLEAQARLLALREAQKGDAQARPAREVRDAPPPISLLEFGQAMLLKRRARATGKQSKRDRALEVPRAPAPVYPSPHSKPVSSQAVKVYPSLAIGMLDAGLSAPGRIYWLLKYLDKQGRGWVGVDRVRDNLASHGAKLRVCSWRRLRQILNQGEGFFWQRDEIGRIWLKGAAKIARNLSVRRFAGNPVEIPVKALLGGIQAVRAHFYASFHSGRRDNQPISRETLRNLTSVPERSQQRYDQVAQVKRDKHFAVGERYTQANTESRAWKQGRGIFHFLDVSGNHGPAGREYIAWHLPNSYQGPHAKRNQGRQKKINQQLVDLVMKGMRGNDPEQVDKLFYHHGAEAGKAFNCDQGKDAYWPQGYTRGKRFMLWYVLPSL